MFLGYTGVGLFFQSSFPYSTQYSKSWINTNYTRLSYSVATKHDSNPNTTQTPSTCYRADIVSRLG